MTMSGASPFGCSQPSEKVGGGGRSASFPLGAPASTQAISVSISCWLRVGSLLNFMLLAGSAGQGGISRRITFSLIDSAKGRAESYDSNGKDDPISPGRWQLAQCLNRIGATSLLNVGADAWAADATGTEPNVIAMRAPAIHCDCMTTPEIFRNISLATDRLR